MPNQPEYTQHERDEMADAMVPAEFLYKANARIAQLEADLANRTVVSPPDLVGPFDSDEMGFNVEWHDDDRVYLLAYDDGQFAFTTIENGKVVDKKKWKSPHVTELEAENARLRGIVERVAALHRDGGDASDWNGVGLSARFAMGDPEVVAAEAAEAARGKP